MNEMKGVEGRSHDGQKRMRVWIFYLGGLLLLLVLEIGAGATILFRARRSDRKPAPHHTTGSQQ